MFLKGNFQDTGKFLPFPNKNKTLLQQFLKLSSATWFMQKASGYTFPKLLPRTLPNGVKNGDWVQNVSDDKLASSISWFYPSGEFVGDIVGFYSGALSGSANTVDSIQSDNYPTLSYGGGKTQKGIMKQATAFVIGVPRAELVSENVAGLTEWFTRNPITIRYQLATPIDKLNSPFVNPVLDLKGRVGKNLFDGCLEMGIYTPNTQGSTVTKAVSASSVRNLNPIPIIGGQTYTFKTNVGDTRIWFTNDLDLILDSVYTGVSPMILTAPALATRFYFRVGSTDLNRQIQLELGSVATAYEPYGKANLLLKNFAGTPSSGIVDVPCKHPSGDVISYSNLIVGGDFPSVAGWSGVSSILSASSKVLIVTGNGINPWPTARQDTALQLQTGDRYLLRVRMRSRNAQCQGLSFAIKNISNVEVGSYLQSSPIQDQWYPVTVIRQIGATSGALRIELFGVYADGATANGKVIEFEEVMSVNLTTNPQILALEAKLGRPLTPAECGELFAFTPTSATVNVKGIPMLKFDAVDDHCIANHPNLDIIGTGDFAIATMFKTGGTLVAGYFAFKGLDGIATSQYGCYTEVSGAISFLVNGNGYTIIPASTLQPNTNYTLLVWRFNGRLKARLLKTETYNQLNNINIATRPHFRVGARTASADGLTHGDYTNIALAHLSIINGAVTPFTEADLIAKWDRYCAKEFGL